MSGFEVKQHRKTSAYIDLRHMAWNVQLLRTEVGENSFFCPMVKANAYGHGDVEVALKLQSLGVQTLGVGLIEEGILLRQMGVTCEILVFGVFTPQDVHELVRHKLTPVLSQWQQIEALETQTKTSYPVHVKIDTGMHRLGFSFTDHPKLVEHFKKENRLKLQGVCTHLSTAEDCLDTQGESFNQLKKFSEIENNFTFFRPVFHSLNSAGLLNFAKMRKGEAVALPGISLNQGVRPGLSVYGYSPVKNNHLGSLLKPVMSLRSKIAQYQQIDVGQGVSYNKTWRASRRSTVGVLPIGYADGYHRLLSNRGVVLLAGQKLPIVGNVCMDFLMVDLTELLKTRSIESLQGNEVTLFGYDENGQCLMADELAEKSQTITWEILTSIGERVPRVFIDDQLQSGKQREMPL